MPEKRGLILSRRVGEKIVISQNIVVTVLSIDKGRIRLGLEAPLEVPIKRIDQEAGK